MPPNTVAEFNTRSPTPGPEAGKSLTTQPSFVPHEGNESRHCGGTGDTLHLIGPGRLAAVAETHDTRCRVRHVDQIIFKTGCRSGLTTAPVQDRIFQPDKVLRRRVRLVAWTEVAAAISTKKTQALAAWSIAKFGAANPRPIGTVDETPIVKNPISRRYLGPIQP